VLRESVIPAWREPARWRAMMQSSIAMAVEKFSSDRMVTEYFERLYPVAANAAGAAGTLSR
jgi:glucan phosphorylase